MMKKHFWIKRTAAVFLAVVITAGALPQTAQISAAKAAKNLPEKIDLRNYNGKNYVTPVKLQNPFGTCWGFAIAAAAEISYLYENDLGVPAGEPNNNVDFSEKDMGWYYYNALTGDDVLTGVMPASQVGEGYDTSAFENKNEVYNIGGFPDSGATYYMSGMGPKSEDLEIDGTYPYAYKGKNGWVENVEGDAAMEEARKQYVYNFIHPGGMFSDNELSQIFGFSAGEDYDTWFNNNYTVKLKEIFTKNPNYAGFDDWSLPLNSKYRFSGVKAFVKNSNRLQAPASYPVTGPVISANYTFDPAGVEAIKSEIAEGKGVAIAYFADQSRPNQDIGDDGYMNTVNWAQYTNEVGDMTHDVCIVGYDDNYDKNNFTRVMNGKVVEESTPPGNGAFIVKNSWGAITKEDTEKAVKDASGKIIKYTTPNANSWGIDDTGYFYLSYYDLNIRRAETYDFYEIDESPEYTSFNQYDFMPVCDYYSMQELSPGYDYSMANVFTAEEDYILTSIAAVTAEPGSTVEYFIYIDANEKKGPESGYLIEKGKEKFDYAGYQRFDLDYPLYLNRGDKFSVVIRETCKNDGKTVSTIPIAASANTSNNTILRSVINPGESFLKQGKQWTDLAVCKKSLESVMYDLYVSQASDEGTEDLFKNKQDDVQVDNFPIKAIGVTKQLQDIKLAGKDITRKELALKVSAKKLKKKAVKYKVVSRQKGKLGIMMLDKKTKKYIKLKNGKLTVKKNTPKGTYVVIISAKKVTYKGVKYDATLSDCITIKVG